MLDATELAEFEAWKHEKFVNQSQDLTFTAYQAETQGPALAYEAGVRDGFQGAANDFTIDDVIADSPYRKPGMAGER